jgi:hypothetical protein
VDIGRRGVQMSINQFSELTGKDRRTVTQRLRDLEFDEGPKSAHLYNSAKALELIYGGERGAFEAARTRQALSQAELNEVRTETERKKRIPIDIPLLANDQVTQSVASTLKAAKGKPLTEKLINKLLQKFRDIPAQLKW